MSGIEYYHIKGYIAPAALRGVASPQAEAELDIPTAPMYRDLESYNGKCAIWLKHICLANTDLAEAGTIRNFQRTNCPMLVMKGCPSLNQIGLKVNRGLLWPGGSSPLAIAAGATRMETRGGFRDATFYCPFNATHLDINGTSGLLGEDFKITGATTVDSGASGGTGAGDGNNAPAQFHMIDNAKFMTEYINPSVGNMADAVIVNNIWGKRQTFAFEGSRKGIFNAGQVDSFIDYYGDISFELVIQPLKNEPIYRGLPDDDKQRRI
jgi:hypothetical protein